MPPITVKRDIRRNADDAKIEADMIAKLEQLLAEAKGQAPGDAPEGAEGIESQPEAAEEARCETCGQPLPMAPHEVDSTDSSVIN